jgi:hypothetical protein
VTIQAKHLEAAARLALLRDDFEPSGLDLLCLGLQDSPAQLELLRQWVLGICTMLIDPNASVKGRKASREKRSGSSLAYISQVTPLPVDLARGSDCDVWTQERRFDYFRSKVCRLLLWRDEGLALLDALRSVAQQLMDSMAGQYEERYGELCAGSRGAELQALALNVMPASAATGRTVARQDDEQVLIPFQGLRGTVFDLGLVSKFTFSYCFFLWAVAI